ncbi:MAG TPA: hypothetical protein VGO55_13515 [Allosphingosinicella sp.]|jgi:hypothetical protein|nr:hypothetical protein [Allosphingosinicella sp.]
MEILTGTWKSPAHLSVMDTDLGVPKYRPGEIIEAIARSGSAHATPFRAAAWTANPGLGATIMASGPATEESKVLEKVIKSLASSLGPAGKGAVKGYKLGQSSLKLAAAFSDPDASLLAKAKAGFDAADDFISFLPVPFPQLAGDAFFQAVGHFAAAGALICDLCGAFTPTPEHRFEVRIAS